MHHRYIVENEKNACYPKIEMSHAGGGVGVLKTENQHAGPRSARSSNLRVLTWWMQG